MLDISNLENKIGIIFKNKNLLKEALTHRSYLNENPSWDTPNNERLEFLGDAVLELIITEELFSKFPKSTEGELTNIRAALVNYQMLSEVAKSIDLNNFILLSRGESKDTGKARDVILANAFESLLGAIYLDAGVSKACEFVKNTVLKYLDKVLQEELYKDPKSLLQEIAQEKFKITPTYSVISEHGPDHAKTFNVGVYFNNSLIAEGSGSSKQEAEVEAAKNALLTLKNKL